MACLETTFLVDLLQGKKDVKELKEEIDRTENAVSVAAPSVMELWTGTLLSKIPAGEKEKINELLLSLTILPLDEKSAKESGEIEAELIKTGMTIETEDIMIAGIARANGETVVTRDPHYARIRGLKVLKY